MTETQTIAYVNQMTPLEKLSAYMDYFIDQTALKHRFEVADCGDEPPNGHGQADKQFGALQFRYLWKDMPIITMEQFTQPGNVRTTDNGHDWQRRGFAQQKRTDLFGIYRFVHLNSQK